MKIALSTLKQYISITLSSQELEELLVRLGFEVEGVEQVGYCASGDLVIGRVLRKEKHPSADRLHVCRVDIRRGEPLQIVCGATNFRENDLVSVALPGCQIGDITLKKSNLRGVESCGMMCSARELGLGDNHEGLYILNDFSPTPTVGQPLEELFGDKRDTVFDLSITPNRGDCLNYLGIARELGAALNLPVKVPTSDITLPDSQDLHVELKTDDCDFYAACLLKNVSVGHSPDWLKQALERVGIRSINNVVDVTNFVLLEYGQPMHAFDAECINGRTIIVRGAQAWESLKTLDGITRPLPQGSILITDQSQILALGGIMGGEASEIQDTTQQILLESAHFKAHAIRKSSRLLDLTSDSSYRFERFVDKTQTLTALKRAVQLLLEMDSNIVCEQSFVAGSDVIPTRKFEFDFEAVVRLLGFPIEPSTFVDTLEKLHFECEWKVENRWEVSIPSYREDVEGMPDLVEEFLRLYGTDKIPTKLPDAPACRLPIDSLCVLRDRHAQIFSTNGFFECYTDSLQPLEWYKDLLSKEERLTLQMANPLSAEHACLRVSLIPGLLNALCENRNRGNNTERLFESGQVFRSLPNSQICELFASACVLCPSELKRWQEDPNFNFYALKSLVNSLIVASGGSENTLQSIHKDVDILWQKDYAARVGIWGKRGFEAHLGYINLDFSSRWFPNTSVLAAECLWVPERYHLKGHKIFQPYSEFPVVHKDLALMVDRNLLAETVRKDVEVAARKSLVSPVQLKEVYLFDVFQESENLDKKSLAFTLTFHSNVETLTDTVVNTIFEKVQTYLEERCKYTVRRR